MDKVEYEALLNKFYDGKVTAKTRYINPNAVLFHKCLKCNERFYGVPKFMVGSESQRHICNRPYGDSYGERGLTVHGAKQSGKKKTKKEEQPEYIWKRITEMVWEDYTYQKIATELQVNPNIIKDYFKTEGLI